MKETKKFKKSYMYIVAFLIVMLLSFLYKTVLNMRADKIIVKGESSEISEVTLNSTTSDESNSDFDVTTAESTDINTISIYVCGAVNNPGVYEISKGSILNEAIILAGGFTEEAATDYVNLVYRISDNISIYIPRFDEVSNFEGIGDGVIRGSEDLYIWGESVSNENTTVESDFTDIDSNEGKININTASQEMLMTLPGIGEATAQAIIDYRQTNQFISIEDIMNVSGIGEAKFNRIRAYICV